MFSRSRRRSELSTRDSIRDAVIAGHSDDEIVSDAVQANLGTEAEIKRVLKSVHASLKSKGPSLAVMIARYELAYRAASEAGDIRSSLQALDRLEKLTDLKARSTMRPVSKAKTIASQRDEIRRGMAEGWIHPSVGVQHLSALIEEDAGDDEQSAEDLTEEQAIARVLSR